MHFGVCAAGMEPHRIDPLLAELQVKLRPWEGVALCVAQCLACLRLVMT